MNSSLIIDQVIAFCETFETGHLILLGVMLLLGLLLGFLLWFRPQKSIDQLIEDKERAENYAAARERALEKIRKEIQELKNNNDA